MQFTIQFSEAEDGGALASTLRRIAAAFDPSAHITTAHKIVGFTDEPVNAAPTDAEVSAALDAACAVADKALDKAVAAADVARGVTKTRRTRSTKAAEVKAVEAHGVTDPAVAEAVADAVDTLFNPENEVTVDDARVLSLAADTGESVDAIAAAYNAAAAAAGAPTIAEIEQATAVDPEQERRALLESIAPLLEKAGFPWYRANVPGGKRLAEIAIEDARELHAKVTAFLAGGAA